MDLLHLHLLLNHAPVVGVIGAALLLIAALISRSRDLVIAGLVALVLVALIALPVFFTGEPAEERVENLPGINETTIEAHEDAATAALIAIEIAGAVALAALLASVLRKRVPVVAAGAALVVAVVASALIARAANLGGEIRHTELSAAAAPAIDHGDDDD